MKSQPSKLIMITAIIVILVAVVLASLTWLIDINSYKPRIESSLSEATGLNVKLNGRIGLSLFPPGVVADDIHVTRNGQEILSLQKLKLGVALWPLLKKQINVTRCRVVSPTLTIVKEATGKYNFATAGKKSSKGNMGPAGVKVIKVSHGLLVFLDKRTGEKTALKDIDLTVKDLQVAQTSGSLMKNISFTGSVNCGELQRKNLKIENLGSSLNAANGLIHFQPLSMDIFGTKGEGALTVNLSGTNPVLDIDLKVLHLDFAKLQESFGKKSLMDGKGDLDAFLTLQIKEHANPLSSTKGAFSLQGNNLVLHTMDLDKLLSMYGSNKETDLVSIGSMFIAGPLSAAAVGAYRSADAYYEARKGQSNILKFIAKWKINNGVANAEDCALATHRNRIAARGKLNLVNERYENLTVALVDHKGCAKFKQTITGPFANPRISTISALQLLGTSIINLYGEAKDLVQNGNCDVFYSGSVEPP